MPSIPGLFPIPVYDNTTRQFGTIMARRMRQGGTYDVIMLENGKEIECFQNERTPDGELRILPLRSEYVTETGTLLGWTGVVREIQKQVECRRAASMKYARPAETLPFQEGVYVEVGSSVYDVIYGTGEVFQFKEGRMGVQFDSGFRTYFAFNGKRHDTGTRTLFFDAMEASRKFKPASEKPKKKEKAGTEHVTPNKFLFLFKPFGESGLLKNRMIGTESGRSVRDAFERLLRDNPRGLALIDLLRKESIDHLFVYRLGEDPTNEAYYRDQAFMRNLSTKLKAARPYWQNCTMERARDRAITVLYDTKGE